MALIVGGGNLGSTITFFLGGPLTLLTAHNLQYVEHKVELYV
jgi:hypothetical protein